MAPSLMATVCTALRSAASSFQQHVGKGFCSCRFSIPIVSNNGASDREEDASDSDDEWGIVHSQKVHPTRPRPSRVQLNTKSHGVEVSLALSVAACHRAPPGLRLQRSRATWTFSSVDGYSRSMQYPRCSIRFVQAPTFTVDLMMLNQFDAYVTDRLQLAARRHAEWTKGSTLSWSPRLTTVANVNASGIATTPQPACTDESASKATKQMRPFTARNGDTRTQPHQQLCPISRDQQHSFANRHVKFTKTKETRRPRMQRFAAEARYMNYEQSASYTRKRQVNIERRRALQSLSKRNPADSRCVLGSTRRSDLKYSAAP